MMMASGMMTVVSGRSRSEQIADLSTASRRPSRRRPDVTSQEICRQSPKVGASFDFKAIAAPGYRRHSVMKHCGLMLWPFPKNLLGDLRAKILLLSKEEDTERFSSGHCDQEFRMNVLQIDVN